MIELLLVVLTCIYAPFWRFYLYLRTVCALLRKKRGTQRVPLFLAGIQKRPGVCAANALVCILLTEIDKLACQTERESSPSGLLRPPCNEETVFNGEE